MTTHRALKHSYFAWEGIGGGLGVICLVLALLSAANSGRAAGLLIADGGFGGKLEIEEHDVAVTINNGVVVTEVTAQDQVCW